MKRKAHQDGMKDFDELDYKEQVLAINMGILQVQKMINANLRRAREEGRNIEKVRQKRHKQVLDLAEKVKRLTGY